MYGVRVAMLPSPRASSAAITPSARNDTLGQPFPTMRGAGEAEPPIALGQFDRELCPLPITGSSRRHLRIAPLPDPITQLPFLVGQQFTQAVGSDGYGIYITRNGIAFRVRPHRYALALAIGVPLGADTFALHQCDSRLWPRESPPGSASVRAR